MKRLDRQDLYDILYGCTILGTGGGGTLDKGIGLIDKALAQGKEFILADPDEIPDDALIGTPYKCGAISPLSEEEMLKYSGLPEADEGPCLKAFRVLEGYMGESFYAVISTELGGGNTAEAFYVGAMLGKYIVDGDPAGRSVPELQHSTYFIKGLPIYPLAVANEFGETAIIKEVVNDFRAEALVRSMAIASRNSIGVVDHPARGKELRNAIIPRAITYALKIGRAFRMAKESGEDLASAVAEAGSGYILFRGKVKNFTWETKEGFTVGETLFEGEGEYYGKEYRIWYKNEHIISWRDGKVDVTVPDLICIVREDTREPVTNPHYEAGMRVSIFGFPAPGEWRTEEGLKVFGPGYFGYNIKYIPIEKMF